MQAYKLMITMSGTVLAVLLTGCSSTPYLDSHFGESVDMIKAQQTINPQASQNMDPVAGIDGKAGQEAMGRYYDSFKTPPSTKDILTIDVLGGGSGSSK
ncbi:hypothetical protein [Pseudogulbenkiania ferrooxidans]|uniref:Lipoprotein n=1 Tax=Pseudogulbenkiania ferrooxidans 2002 TaxID=279714 RepID=B9YZS5_9NEIS|nr:hypothetical protein [Pseudogulbenkiania ferrooxidans]EEG09808.1 conserved hypothetical protein [Pseudogulbenkiania ferrooxidans 2002]